ncbi:exported protein of unknown function [Nitrosotalea devaniterrae]|uniref:Uncharacterized protein n=1 Tax=Nitrosotalea devaniterrae TaxID=1078905 RepID=A0A128A232_9ARCH|nr:exported protein of unknown function [Candidatus Nitrosotalea devanaterra]
MKTLHYSIITGSGISVVLAIGIYLMVFSSVVFSAGVNPSCSSAPNISRDEIVLKKISWISVTEIEKNQTSLDCTTVTSETFLHIPKLEHALSGADQCMQGEDGVCSFASGFGTVMISPSSRVIPVDDHTNYRLSLTQDETYFLLGNVNLEHVGNLIAGDVNYDGKYYQVLLYTGDTPNLPQVNTNFAVEPVSTDDLSAGKSVNYTITVKTLATFGVPVSVVLYPVINAQDSGVTAKIIPDLLSIPERDTVNATLVITAGPEAQNGTYEIGFDGKLQDGGFSGGMRQTNCPCIRIGDSDWTIRTNYGDSGSWGGKSPPSWLRVETTTDKNVYHTGESIEVKNFIINDSPNVVTLESNARLFVTVYNQVNGTGAHRYFYGIDALYDGKPITLAPHSKTIRKFIKKLIVDQNVARSLKFKF